MGEIRESFGSKVGAVLVAAGSAIGLGSIWRFPYVAGENGGGAFILIYLLATLVLGIPVMLSEFAIGTYTRKGPVDAYAQLSKRWKWLGYNSILVSGLISGFYYIVAGWSLEYLVGSVSGSLYVEGTDYHETFSSFCSSWREPLYTMLFILLTHTVVAMGVKNGLERCSKLMMPALCLMLLALAACSAVLPGAAEGYAFLFKPDFEKAMQVDVMIGAIGQAFFSLSIGLGCMIAFSSYFKRGTNLTVTAFSVAGMTVLVSVLSGLVIFPAVFSFGLEPTAGPTLIFETLPYIFAELPLSALWSGTFFLLLAMAALTSTISFHEVITVYFNEVHHIPRKHATRLTTLLSAVLATLCLWSGTLFDAFDALAADVLMPLGGFCTVVFAGWWFDRKIFRDELAVGTHHNAALFPLLRVLLRWICPLLLIITFAYNMFFV